MNDLLSPEQTVEKLFLTGRIDSITCREIEALFRNAIMGGKSLIVADMTAVSYVSSAGLRVFLSVQKELKKNYKKKGSDTWIEIKDGKKYEIKLKNGEWFITVTTRPITNK